MSDTISRRDAFHVIDNCRFVSEQEKKYAYSLMEQVESARSEERTEERTETHACDLISREMAIDEVKEMTSFDNDNRMWNNCIKTVIRVLKRLPSAQSEQNAYEQGRITGRVEMRTEMLTELKKIVGSEVWNDI